MKTQGSKITTSIEHEELFIPVTLYIERRRMMRVAFGKDRILIRLPETLTETQQYKEYIKAKEWVIKTLTKKPELKTPFVVKSYTGLKLDVMGHSYHIYVTEEQGVC